MRNGHEVCLWEHIDQLRKSEDVEAPVQCCHERHSKPGQ
jgi:hypothetical protein